MDNLARANQARAKTLAGCARVSAYCLLGATPNTPGRYRSPEGKESPPQVLLLERGRLAGEPYVYRNEQPFLRFEPGGKLTAQVQLTDDGGQRWLLTWPASESPSKVYTFAVLSQAPRLHPESISDPARGEIAFEVQLVLGQPERFKLPDLLPR